MTETKVMNQDQARRFFPADLSGYFGLGESDIRYFGLDEQRTMEWLGESYTWKSLYIAALASHSFSVNNELSFEKSRNRWIKREHFDFYEMAYGDHKMLYGDYPLLVLRLVNGWQKSDNPFKYAELLRYADHEKFKRKGLASATLNSISQMMKSQGTEVIFVNYWWPNWPKSQNIVPIAFAEDITDGIEKLFPPGFHGKSYYSFSFKEGFLKFTDEKRHMHEHEKAMKKYDAHKKKLARR